MRFDDLPSVRDPADGTIVTANQPVIVHGTGPFLSRDHAYGWRSQRLHELLGDRRGMTPTTCSTSSSTPTTVSRRRWCRC